MKGRTLEELDEMFQNRVSVKNFPTYICISSQQARGIVNREVGESEAAGNEKFPSEEETKEVQKVKNSAREWRA